MKAILWLSASVAALTPMASGEEKEIVPKVESVGLFKNGLCVIRSSFEVTEPGDYRWSEPPRCVHGTFLVDSESAVVVRSGVRKIEEPEDRERLTGALQADLAGQTVRIALHKQATGVPPVITGQVLQLPLTPMPERRWNSIVAPDRNGNIGAETERLVQPATSGGYLVVQTAKERLYVDLSSIATIEVTGAAPERKRTVEKPVLRFQVARAGKVRVSYLTRGASWVPSYFIDLSDPKTLHLQQTALIRNELDPWKGVEMQLISGFPNVQFGHVDSPIWPGATLAGFFQQVGQNPGSFSGSFGQQIFYNNRTASRQTESMPAEMPTDGQGAEDLHFESVGARDLAPGETLSMEVARGSAAYERVVEWTNSDPRNEYGQYQRTNEARDEEQPWDAILFQNPLKFAMTTAAATVTEGGQFRGQTLSQWANPGQRCCLRITKALSVQADHQEIEQEGKREEVTIGGYRYYRSKVTATITLRSFRSQPTVMFGRAQFSGELIAADENPGKTLRKEGVFSINPRNELEWKFVLPPGAEKKLNYSYSVLVRN